MLDDEPKMRSALRRLLRANGYRVEDYADGGEFLAALPVHPADCVVLDLHMPGMSGFEVLAAFAATHITTPVVIMTAHNEPGVAEQTRALGAAAFLAKPVNKAALLHAIESAISSHRSESLSRKSDWLKSNKRPKILLYKKQPSKMESLGWHKTNLTRAI